MVNFPIWIKKIDVQQNPTTANFEVLHHQILMAIYTLPWVWGSLKVGKHSAMTSAPQNAGLGMALCRTLLLIGKSPFLSLLIKYGLKNNFSRVLLGRFNRGSRISRDGFLDTK